MKKSHLLILFVIVLSGSIFPQQLTINRCEFGDCINGFGTGFLKNCRFGEWTGKWIDSHPVGDGSFTIGTNHEKFPCNVGSDGIQCTTDVYMGGMTLTNGFGKPTYSESSCWLEPHGIGVLRDMDDRNVVEVSGFFQYGRLFNGAVHRVWNSKVIIVPYQDGIPDEREWEKEIGITQYVEAGKAGAFTADISIGKTKFELLCTFCHIENSSASLGPSLKDDEWLHGSRFNDVFLSVLNGISLNHMRQVPPKGPCPSHKDSLGPKGVFQVVKYLQSINQSIK